MMCKRILLIFAVLVLCVGCNNKEIIGFAFESSIEKPYTDGSNTKTHLYQEQWVYWDQDDMISIASDKSNDVKIGTLQLRNGGDKYNGVFETELPDNSITFLALFPHDAQNVIQFSNGGQTLSSVKVKFPAVQPRTSDTSFGINVAPMVAYSQDPYPHRLDFHSLFGLVRIQIAAKNPKQLSSIVFTEISTTPKQISGIFDVNQYDTYAPHVAATAASGNNLITTIDCNGLTVGPSKSEFVSFYLVLPAYLVNSSQPANGATFYKLQMKIISADGMQCIKIMNVPIRRNGITYMPSLRIDTWGDNTNNGVVNTSITGNGTKTRPFKIYTIEDLVYVRSCFINGEGSSTKINNVTVDKNTYFKIMRSDIVLTEENWTTRGIPKFTGHMLYVESASSTSGITNNSAFPIFESISSDGVVENIQIKGTYIKTTDVPKQYSPFCTDNRGKIYNCRVSSDAKISLASQSNIVDEVGVAGLCVNNYGVIEGCENSGELNSQYHSIAGICLNNYGTIKTSYSKSPMKVREDTRAAAGICYNNTTNGIVEECYFAVNVAQGCSDWAGIVYKNSGTVKRCFIDQLGIIKTSRTYGGIVNHMEGGLIDYCWNATNLSYSGDYGSGNGGLGGIVNVMSGGEIRNSYCNLPEVTMTVYGVNSYGGGIVGQMMGGNIKNCFSRFHLEGGSGVGSFVGKITGGNIENCYGWDDLAVIPNFYGIKGTGVAVANLVLCRYKDRASTSASHYQPLVTRFVTDEDLVNVYESLNDWVTDPKYMTWNNSGINGQPLLSGTYYTTPSL